MGEQKAREISLTTLSVVAWGLGASIAILAVSRIFVHVDAGYTLSMARALARGQHPFSDLALSHTTVSIYVFGLLAYFFPNQTLPYGFALAVVIAAELGSAVLVYLVARTLGFNRRECGWASSLTFLSMLVSEGLYLELEPFVALFSLLGIYFFLRFNSSAALLPLCCSGFFCGIAILFKQYGALTAAVLSGFLLAGGVGISFRRRLGHVAIFVIPVVGASLLYVVFLWGSSGAPLAEVRDAFLGHWYKKFPENFPVFLSRVFAIHPFVVFSPLLLLSGTYRHQRLVVALALSALLPGFVRQYLHYYIQAIPFFCLTFLYIRDPRGPLGLFSERGRALALYAMLIPLGMFTALTLWSLRLDSRNLQYSFVTAVTEVVPKHSEVFLLGDFSLFYLGEFESPAPKLLGYSFPESLPRDQFLGVARTAQFVIVNEQWFREGHDFVRMLPVQETELLQVINEQHRVTARIGDYVIFRRM